MHNSKVKEMVSKGHDVEGDHFNNIVMLTDSYKVTHHLQYPPDTTTIYSYFESRGGDFKDVCFFGLQYFLKKYLDLKYKVLAAGLGT